MVVTGSEDGYMRLWNSSTYKLENSTNYNMERVWTVAVMKGFNGVAVSVPGQLGMSEFPTACLMGK